MISRLSLIVIILSILIVALLPQNNPAGVVYSDNYHTSCPWQPELYQPAPSSPKKQNGAAGLIVPHHLLASTLIHTLLSQIDPVGIDTVVLVGPNHYGQGIPKIQTTASMWKTPSGTLFPNTKVINELTVGDYAVLVDQTFVKEHSVCGLVGFVPAYFPKAKIVPLVLRSNTSLDEADKLGKQLSQICRNCLLIASVDFTHESASKVAKENDTKSAEILTSLNTNRINGIVADSLPSLQVVMSYALARGVTQGTFVNQADSNSFLRRPESTVTSYLTILYPLSLIPPVR